MKEQPSPRGTLVLGMHRSGTSAVTRVLSILLAQDLQPRSSPSNPHGQWERLEFRRHLDRLLLGQGATWDCPPVATVDWTQVSDPAASKALQGLGSGNWVWKDPRLSLTLGFWLNQLSNEPRLVLALRDPIQVAASLQRRDGRALQHGLALWETTMHHLITDLNGRQVYVVNHVDLLQRTEGAVHDLASWVGVSSQPRLEAAVATIVPPQQPRLEAGLGSQLSEQQVDLAQYLDRPSGPGVFELPLPDRSPNLGEILGQLSKRRQAGLSLRNRWRSLSASVSLRRPARIRR